MTQELSMLENHEQITRYTDWLIQYIKDNPTFIQPETHRQNILSRLEKGAQNDLSISRTTFSHGEERGGYALVTSRGHRD